MPSGAANSDPAAPGTAGVGEAPPSPGDELGPFRVLSQLGQGGSGSVFAARWGERDVAVKVLRADLELTDKERRRFLDEAEMLARVRHPGVVEVVTSGTLPDGRPYLAMPLLSGQSLAERLAEGGALTVARALELFDGIADAVAALHEAGLLHRDLKPENVFLVDGAERALLLDLGIAKDRAAAPSTTTQAGLARGTPATMAPERFFGAPASESSEVYELGLLLYAMLVGRLPWDDAADVHARLDPKSPIEAGVTVPAAVSAELMKALSTRTERRPLSVKAFAERIRAAHREGGDRGARVTAEVAVQGLAAGARAADGDFTAARDAEPETLASDAEPETLAETTRPATAIAIAVTPPGAMKLDGLDAFARTEIVATPGATPRTPNEPLDKRAGGPTAMPTLKSAGSRPPPASSRETSGATHVKDAPPVEPPARGRSWLGWVAAAVVVAAATAVAVDMGGAGAGSAAGAASASAGEAQREAPTSPPSSATPPSAAPSATASVGTTTSPTATGAAREPPPAATALGTAAARGSKPLGSPSGAPKSSATAAPKGPDAPGGVYEKPPY